MAPLRRRRNQPSAFRWSVALQGLGVAVGLGLAGLQVPDAARADYASGQSKQEQQFYDYGPSGSGSGKSGGSILDSTNPMDLMNKLRKSTAMDEATPPGDAIDQALKALNAPPAQSQQTVQVPLRAP
jgi:hypothetical protein